MLPLIVLQLLAVRDILGHFTFYYGTPFLLITAGQLLVAAVRARDGGLGRTEPAALLVAAILGSSPLLYATGLPSSFPMVAATLSQPARADLVQIALQAEAAVAKTPKACVSYNVAALVPDAVTVQQLMAPDSDLANCETAFLFVNDVHAPVLMPKLAGWVPGPVIADRVQPYTRRPQP
jgi:hypothetical protein